MRRFFKGGWSSDTCSRLALRLFIRQPVTPDIVPPLRLSARAKSSGDCKFWFDRVQRSGVGGTRKLRLPHRKHNKILNGKLTYGGY